MARLLSHGRRTVDAHLRAFEPPQTKVSSRLVADVQLLQLADRSRPYADFHI